MFEFYKNWMEFFFLVLMVIGLIVALVTPSAVIGYILVFLSGFFAGRVLYERRNNIIFPFFIIIAGFVIGYLAGMRYGERTIAAISFVIGAIVSYKLYSKKILRDIRF
ncbi:hypothetical protein HYX00_03510 [Candidatus Woesearchaeota archaeon]|nr:hypothetical protein [Candidatus Woesearchaeota archaeon]